MNPFEQTIKNRIFCGEYPVGAELSSERHYGEEFGLPKSQVHRILQKMVREGYLSSRRGSGYRVRERQCTNNSEQINTLFIIPDYGMISRLFGALINKARELNIRLDFEETKTGEELESLLLKTIRDNRYAAVLIHPTPYIRWNKGFSCALENHFPILFRNHTVIPGAFCAIGPNHFELGLQGCKLMSARGYRRIAFIGYTRHLNIAFQMRHDGFEAGRKYYELDQVEDFLFDEVTFPNVHTAVEQIVASGHYDGIFASTGSFTINAILSLQKLQLKLPEQLGFLGVNYPLAVPGQEFIADCISEDPELLIEKTLTMLRDISTSRYLNLSHNLFVTPKYLPGNTMREVVNQPATSSA